MTRDEARDDNRLTESKTISVNRLSAYQEGVLLWLLDAYRRVEPSKMLDVWGIPIKRRPDGTSRAESAADSRALRRLEDRGLVERRNGVTGDKYSGLPFTQHRTTNLRFTPAGREVAERLDQERGA